MNIKHLIIITCFVLIHTSCGSVSKFESTSTPTPTVSPTVTITPTPWWIVENQFPLILLYDQRMPISSTWINWIDLEGINTIKQLKNITVGGEISPNGQLIAYDNCSNPRGIYISQIDGSNPEMIAPLKGQFCTKVRWSFDMTMLSFSDPKDYSLHIINIKSGESTFLSNNCYIIDHSWAPTGDRIVDGSGCGGDDQLYITDLQGNYQQLIYKSDYPDCRPFDPRWSPDGKKIVFTCDGYLYLISPDGSNAESLKIDQNTAINPVWSPDSKWIVFIIEKYHSSTQNDLMLYAYSINCYYAIQIGKIDGAWISIGPYHDEYFIEKK